MPQTKSQNASLAPTLQDPSRKLETEKLYNEALEIYQGELVEDYHRGVSYLKHRNTIVNIPPSSSIGDYCVFIADEISFGQFVKVGSNTLIGTVKESGSVTIWAQVTIGNNSVLMNNAHTEYAYKYPEATILVERLEEDEE